MHDRAPALSTLAAFAGDRGRGRPDHKTAPHRPRSWTEEAAASGEPATASLEELIAALEGGTAAVAFASPEAMLHVLGRVLLRPGEEIVAARESGDTVTAALAHSFPGFGWRVAWANLDERTSFEDAIGPRTKAILAPSVSGDGTIADLAMLGEVARRAGVPLVIDNTLATPALCRPLDHGAHIVLHSSAAGLGGGGDPGILVDGGTFDWQREGRQPALSEADPQFDNAVLAETFGNFAFAAACRLLGSRAFAAPIAAAEATRLLDGIATLALRAERQRGTARALAERLDARADLAWVRHAGLPGNRYHNLAKRYVAGSGAPIITFRPARPETAEAFLAALSLVMPVGRIAYGGRSQVERVASGAGSPFFRLWVGIEDEADLVADLEEALVGASA
ncbi:MAG: PLP-dependent transferase [Bauldia sp.]|nr:PLP-dependent transferase [Bauldia sp.]